MRVSFDGLSITARPSGVGGTALRLLEALARHRDAPRIVAVLPEASAADAAIGALANVELVRAPFAAPDTPRALWFQHVRMPRLLEDAGIDAHVAPAFVLPQTRWHVPSIVVFHDASWRRFPRTKSRRFRAYLDLVVPRSVRSARAVVAVSEFAGAELRSILPDVDPSKIHVVPWGVERREGTGEEGGVPRPYLLSVSNFDRRKNLPALVEAWRRLVREDGLPHALVLVGDPGRAAALRRDVGARDDERLVTPGYVDSARLAALYAGTDLVVVPSLYEGFGLPVVEAFAAGAAVACSNTSSLPEVAAEAAVLFDAGDVASMSAAIREALCPGPEREARIERGRRRAAELTWERTADRYVALLATTSRGRPA